MQLGQYPASFFICRQSPKRNAASFAATVDTTPVRIAIPREAIALLYTRSTINIKVYELAPINSMPVFSFEDALKRDRED